MIAVCGTDAQWDCSFVPQTAILRRGSSRTTDTAVHTWDLARAVGIEDTLDHDPVAWIDAHIHEVYAGMAESPIAERTTHGILGAPVGDVARTCGSWTLGVHIGHSASKVHIVSRSVMS